MFRNGVGESYRALNETMSRFGTVAEARVKTLLQGMYICMGVVAVVYLVCFSIILAKIYQIQTQVSKIWEVLYSVPRGTLVELKRKALDRLKNLHSEEVEGEDESRALQMRSKPLVDQVWVVLLVLTVLFAGISLGFYTYIYQEGLAMTTTQLLERSSQTQIIYTHKTSIILTWVWATEVLFEISLPPYAVLSYEFNSRFFSAQAVEFEAAYSIATSARHTISKRISMVSSQSTLRPRQCCWTPLSQRLCSCTKAC